MMGASQIVSAVAQIHGLPDAPVTRPGRAGDVNDTVIVGSGLERYVLRTPLDGRLSSEYAIEQWCSDNARAGGIPTPRVLAIGVATGIQYSIQEFVDGVDGESLRSGALWRTLGEYAHIVNDRPIETAPDQLFSRFGRDPVSAWRQHLDYNLVQLDGNDPLIGLGVYTTADQQWLRAVIEILADVPLQFGLSHGDMALRNLLVDPDSAPTIIDWGSAAIGPVPHTDLLNLLRNRDENENPNNQEIGQFCAGYGLDLRPLHDEVSAMQVSGAIDLMRWARDARPDRLKEAAGAARSPVFARSPDDG